MPSLVAVKSGPYKQVLRLVDDGAAFEALFPVGGPAAVNRTAPTSALKSREIRVKVLAAGLAFPDVLTIEGRHVRPLGPVPQVMGQELSGIVTEVGSGVTKMKVGDWVFGRTGSGAWTPVTKMFEEQAYTFAPSPNLDPNVLAGFLMNYGTTWHALVDRARLRAGEWCLILGASGGVGLAAIDIAKALGAKVIACASGVQKLEVCKRAGADFCVDYSQGPTKMREEIERITGGRAGTMPSEAGGVDVIYDPVGGATSEAALRTLRFHGRFLVVGFASGGVTPKSSIPSIPLNLALLNEREILGVLYGTWRGAYPAKDRENINTMVELMRQGKLKPLVEVYPLKDYLKAIDSLMNRGAVGKTVFSLNPELGGKL